MVLRAERLLRAGDEQAVIAMLRKEEFEQPLQFENFRD